jgi:SAM-dependent methyltransferase
MENCLNIGCGTKLQTSTPEKSWVNLDLMDYPGVVKRDICRGLPFNDQSFNRVLCDNVLEHFVSEDAIFLLNEIGRVLKPWAEAIIIVPHKDSQGSVQDPTHKSLWVPRSCLYWNQEDTPYGGKAVGITANLVRKFDPVVYGDMASEAFIKFELINKPY